MGGLIRNELSKFWHQTAFRVMMILLALLLVAVPLLLNAAVEASENTVFWRTTSEDYTEMAESNYMYLQEWGEYGFDSLMYVYMYRAYAEAEKYLEDNGLIGTWKETEYRSRCQQAAWQAVFCEWMEREPSYVPTDMDGWIVWGKYYNLPTDIMRVVQEVLYAPEKDAQGNPVLPDVDFAEEAPIARAAWESVKATVLSATPKDLMLANALAYETSAENLRRLLAEQKEAGATEEECFADETRYEQVLRLGTLYRAFAESGVTPDSWQVRMAQNLSNAYDSLACQTKVSEEEFRADGYFVLRYENYEDYCAAIDDNRETERADISAAQFSLEKDVCPDEFGDNSRTLARTAMSLAGGLVTLLLILMAVHTVTSEFTSGTVRLLLIRPRTRAKILGSKMLVVLFFGLAYWFFGGTVSFIEILCARGVAITTPEICCLGGQYFLVPAYLFFLGQIGLQFLSSMLMVSIAFLFAVLCAKPALPYLLTYGFSFFGSTAQMVLLYVGTYRGWYDALCWTIFGNIDLPARFCGVFGEYTANGSLLAALFSTVATTELASPHIGINVLIVVAHVALFTALAFLAFRKKEIKS